nr:protein FAM98A-like isoform X1 [Ipomoea batatas]
MDRYQKVEKPKPESPINENEIRITSQGLLRNYISYATSLLQERRGKEIVLKAMGQAISKTVAITEIIKRRFPGLHQDTAISSVSITDVWEPIEEGLETVEQTRHVSMISITLSTKELNKSSPGYQAPSHSEQQGRWYNNYQPQQHQPPRQALAVYNAGNEGDDSKAALGNKLKLILMVEEEAVVEGGDGVGAEVVMGTIREIIEETTRGIIEGTIRTIQEAIRGTIKEAIRGTIKEAIRGIIKETIKEAIKASNLKMVGTQTGVEVVVVVIGAIVALDMGEVEVVGAMGVVDVVDGWETVVVQEGVAATEHSVSDWWPCLLALA